MHTKTASRLTKKNKNEGLTYFIGAVDSGPVKIGFTSKGNAHDRLQQLKTASPENLVILGTIFGPATLEKEIHCFLSHCKIRREWFHREPALAMFEILSVKQFDHEDGFAAEMEKLAFERIWVRDEDADSLHVTVARHLLWDIADSLSYCRTDRRVPFASWLFLHCQADSPIGDLARDALHDTCFPMAGSLTDYLEYIMGVSGRKEVTRTIIDAWIECHNYLTLFIRNAEDKQRLQGQTINSTNKHDAAHGSVGTSAQVSPIRSSYH